MQNQCSWDENIFSEKESMWSDLLADLKQIEILTVKRFAFLQPKEIIIPVSLRGFCDSSSQVYCGMVYMVYCGMVKVLKNALVALKGHVSIDSVCFWLDSEFSLCWVKGKEKCCKPCVENRVVRIRNIIHKDSWYHISGVNNPADISTRVCKINGVERWFDGPQFLYKDIDVSKFDVGDRLKYSRSGCSK